MHSNLQNRIPRLLAAPLLLLLSACPIQETAETENQGQSPPGESRSSVQDVLDTRAKYRVSLTGLTVVKSEDEIAGMEEPAEDAGMTVSTAVESASAVAAEEAQEGEELDEELADPSSGPRPTEVMLDLIVRFLGPGKPLPGITVEVTHADPYGTEKALLPTWVDAPGLRRGEKRTVSVRLEGIEYEEGDEFYVEFSPFVPPENRAGYREFAEAGR